MMPDRCFGTGEHQRVVIGWVSFVERRSESAGRRYLCPTASWKIWVMRALCLVT